MCKFYRVITFQSKEVVNILLQNKLYLADINKAREGSICKEDVDACSGNTPIWVFQHPAFCFDNIGDKQFCNMLETFRCEMSISTLSGLYMIELHLDYQPPIGKAHNGCSLACIIPSISMNEVAGIYKLNQTEFYFYDITPYRVYNNDCLFSGIYRFNKDGYKNDNLPTLSLSKFKNDKEYYDYDKVLYAYVLDIVGNKRLDLFIDDIINMLPNHELGLVELYDEVTKIMKESATIDAESDGAFVTDEFVKKALEFATTATPTTLLTRHTKFNSDSEHYVKNVVASCIFEEYKNKFNISDNMWENELERLQTLCGSSDTNNIADFIQKNFL